MITGAVTALFVPGDRPDRYAKAVASGADVVIIDLEDAVAAPAKASARASVVAALRPAGNRPAGIRAVGIRAVVRVNAPGSSPYADDLRDLADLAGGQAHGLLGVMVPKAADPEVLAEVAQRVGVPVVALVESAAGVARARELAAVPGVVRLAFGALDFALDVGADVDAITGQVARAEVVIASRAAGLSAPWESPSTDLTDSVRVEETSRAARRLGFGGRLCIHPSQLAPVRAGFAPTAAEIAWARRIAGDGDGVERVGDGVERVGDQMVDRPVLERARRILRLAGETP